MTTAELIAQLQKLDPTGKRDVYFSYDTRHARVGVELANGVEVHVDLDIFVNIERVLSGETRIYLQPKG